MAGYWGYSKSNNAVSAENDGRYPLSKAVPLIAKLANVSQKIAREKALEHGSSEYHHTSKFYNATDYYCVKEVVDLIKYNNPYYSKEIEDEKRQVEIEINKKETENLRANCTHNFEEKYFTGKNGVKFVHHYKCTICGIKKGLDNIIY